MIIWMNRFTKLNQNCQYLSEDTLIREQNKNSLDGNRGPRAPPRLFFMPPDFFFILKVSIFRICQVPSWNNVPKASFLTLCCTRPEPEKSKNYIESGITFEVNNIQRQMNTFSPYNSDPRNLMEWLFLAFDNILTIFLDKNSKKMAKDV